MAAHATPGVLLPDAGGVERRFARLMPALVLGSVMIAGIAWWMAAQPPPGPGWGNPNDPQAQGQQPPPGYPPQPPEPAPASGSACSNLDCGDCGDCASAIDCGDCDISGLDCSGCAVAGAKAPVSAAKASSLASTPPGKSCSIRPWSRLAQSSGLLLPLFVLIGWRRRVSRARPATS